MRAHEHTVHIQYCCCEYCLLLTFFLSMHFHGKCILIQMENKIADKRLDMEHDVYSKVVKIHSRIPDSLCCIQINMHISQHHSYN